MALTKNQQNAMLHYTKRMEQVVRDGGGEQGHGDADDILCEALRALGQDELVDAYECVQPKWYA